MPNAPHRSVLPWITVAAVCLVVAGVTFWRSHARPKLVPRADAVALEEAPVASPAPSRPAFVAGAPGAPADPAAMAEASNRQHAQVQGIVDRTRATLMGRYTHESVDTTWSNTMERQLVSLADSDQIRAMHANVANLEVDCRTSMCRVSGDVPSITAGDDWFTLYMTNVGGAMPEAAYRYVRNPDGTLHIEVFGIARR